MNVDKETFAKEVKKILDIEKNPEMKKKLDRAYELSANISSIDDRREAQRLVDEILEYLFKDKFSTSYSIPIEFINGPIGRVLFQLKFGIAEDVYTTSEITAIMDITRALVSHDLGENNLVGIKKGRNIMVYERDLLIYAMSKGMTEEEIRERIAIYNKLKAQGLGDDVIQNEIRKIIHK